MSTFRDEIPLPHLKGRKSKAETRENRKYFGYAWNILNKKMSSCLKHIQNGVENTIKSVMNMLN